MSQDFYVRINRCLREDEKKAAVVIFADHLITAVIFGFYPLLLAFLFVNGIRDPRFILIPSGGFVVLSFLRSKLHFKRPYEVLPITPLVDKKTKEKSFPSRHVFSAFIIAMTTLAAAFAFPSGDPRHAVLFTGAVVLFVLADLLGDMRIFLGVHFLRDTICGTVAGILCGLLFFI